MPAGRRRAMRRSNREGWLPLVLVGALSVSGCGGDSDADRRSMPLGGAGAPGGFAGSALGGASGSVASGAAGSSGRPGAASGAGGALAGRDGSAGAGAGGQSGGAGAGA